MVGRGLDLQNQEKDKKLGSISRTILGIDPGTGRLGWAILEKNKNLKLTIKNSSDLSLVDYGCLETKANTPLPERLKYIYNGVCEAIRKYHPTELAIEEIFFVKNIKTGISVAHARGVVILAAKQNNLEIHEYKPNEIKLAISGYGHASKDQMRKMLSLHLKNCIINQDDAADAVAVALCHLQCNRKFRI